MGSGLFSEEPNKEMKFGEPVSLTTPQVEFPTFCQALTSTNPTSSKALQDATIPARYPGPATTRPQVTCHPPPWKLARQESCFIQAAGRSCHCSPDQAKADHGSPSSGKQESAKVSGWGQTDQQRSPVLIQPARYQEIKIFAIIGIYDVSERRSTFKLPKSLVIVTKMRPKDTEMIPSLVWSYMVWILIPFEILITLGKYP